VSGKGPAPRAPSSTYRLQLHEGFRFADALAVVQYLDDLGAGGVYSSPILRAEKGTTHGYDVVDHGTLDPALGTDDDHRALTDALRGRGMHQVVDFVPNHIGIRSAGNAAWRDVLESGRASAFADWFDIEWEPPDAANAGKVLLPVLGRQFGQEVDDGKITLAREGGAFVVVYYDRRLPASPRSYALVVERTLGGLDVPHEDPARQELESVLSAIRHLPHPTSCDANDREERAREKEVVKRRLRALFDEHPAFAAAADAATAAISATPRALEQFLGEQNYRLSYWRVATEEINYRRFFDVNDLAAIRIEDPAVFSAAHALLFDLVAQGRITGIRLDHTDGLYDPKAYFEELRRHATDALRKARPGDGDPIYAVAEKILERGEKLPSGWVISGTTGYDYLGVANAVWVDSSAAAAFTRLYADATGVTAPFAELLLEAKRETMEDSFASEIHVLSHLLKSIADRNRHARDFTRASLLRVIKEVIAAFPVYRTYVRPDGSREPGDAAHVERAVRAARRRNPAVEGTIFAFLRDVLLLDDRSDDTVRFAMRFQQVTGPIMAKGMEDTALYRYTRLACLNDVGCDPGRFGLPVSDLHAHNAATLASWPLTMTTSSTHDTKRGEDVRARIAVLSEMPDDWAALVRELGERSRALVGEVDGEPAPSRNDAYLVWQTLVGAMPFEGLGGDDARAAFSDRVAQYMCKAAHEAKVRTSWLNPDEGYDKALAAFVRGVVADRAIMAPLEAFVDRIRTHGATNSLAQLAVRLASPGVADVYQGCELWNLALVDPDNRRPVDYALRRRMLRSLRERGAPTPALAAELVEGYRDGRIKMHVMTTCLRLRREQPALFLEGEYTPLEAGEHLVAFERRRGTDRLVCLAPRLPWRLGGAKHPWPLGDAWGDARVRLPAGGRFREAFTGDTVEGDASRIAGILRVFPVAWLLAS
jgi:(1->4)-alpha-D-glucan 1-alpha-D-glucosylmutase